MADAPGTGAYDRRMPFPLEPPIAPMLAKPTPAITGGDGWV
jgi:hypothetical protein